MSQIASIKQCVICKKAHQSVELVAMIRNREPYTHWYTCPETGEPEYVSLRTIGDDGLEVDSEVVDAIIQAANTGSYFVAVFHRRGGKLLLHSIPRAFPMSAEMKADVIKLLTENFSGNVMEAGERLADPKTVDPPEPAVSLFGEPTN